MDNTNEIDKLFSFNWDCGRMGELEGLFIATDEEVASIMGKEIDFGEVLGKHSEVCGTMEESDITMVSDNRIVVDTLLGTTGRTVSGYNPLDYYDEDA